MKTNEIPLRVLVVDDSEAYRDGLIEFLQQQKGLKIVGEAGGGEQAIYLTSESRPDLVLMDISMPGMNGLLAAREIKTRFPGVKVVFVTVHHEETYQAMGELIGVDGFVPKNFVKEGLKKVLDNIRLGQAQSEDAGWAKPNE